MKIDMTVIKSLGLLLAIVVISPLAARGQTSDDVPEKKMEVTNNDDIKNPTKGKKRLKTLPTQMIVGWMEWVWVEEPGNILEAKLDTGARTCSIHATNIKTFEQDGEKWAQFTISDTSDKKRTRFRVKAPITRVAQIKNDQGGLDERVVVLLKFHIGGLDTEAEFTLNDRSEMNYSVLIGRNVLRKLGAVDSRRKYLLGKLVKPKKVKKGITKQSKKK